MFLSIGHLCIAIAGEITGKVKAKGARHSGDAVVYVAKIADSLFNPPKRHAVMDQKNLKFIPHVLPILAGTTVDYTNSDTVLHNIFSPDFCSDKLNLGTWPKGETRSHTFVKPGCFAVMLCNVHPEMEAYILVLETPYYGVSTKDGEYSIKNVPAGKYILHVWHEKFSGTPREVTVPSTGHVIVNFNIQQ